MTVLIELNNGVVFRYEQRFQFGDYIFRRPPRWWLEGGVTVELFGIIAL